MTNEFNQNQNPHFLGSSNIAHDPIQVVNIDEIKTALFNEVKNGFEFGPTEYIPGPDDKKQSIFLKIANIMGALGRIPKSGYNQSQNYHYVTESDITGAVRPLMAKEKIVMMPSIRTYKVEELPTKYSKLQMGTIEIEWIVRDAESYEIVKFTMIGKGTDMAEKDIYKAITGNKKYALITLFMIDSGDDPERDDSGGQNPQDGPDRSKNNSGNNKSSNQKNSNAGQKQQDAPPTEPPVKQPTKGDLLTRWVVLAGNEKPQKETRAEFDTWYEKQKTKGWDHLAMIQALTKKIQEKNEKQKAQEKSPDGQDGQASN
jgi:hypothetical protein